MRSLCRTAAVWLRVGLLGILGVVTFASAQTATQPFVLAPNERVIWVGDRLMEGEQEAGWIETMLTARFADRVVTFRNLGWSGDTPAGESRLGLSLLQAGKEPPDEGWRQLVRQVDEARPTFAFIGYGMASSFDGPDGLETFRSHCRRLLDTLAQRRPAVRVVILGPIRHEALGAPWPDPTQHNRDLARYERALRELATERQIHFVPLSDRLTASANISRPLTRNGIHLTERGYRILAETMEDALFGSAGDWRTLPQTQTLREAIVRKNAWFFHRSRPGNSTYIFGFRKREQEQNAVEIPRFDTWIEAEEARIRVLKTLDASPSTDVPVPAVKLSVTTIPQPLPTFSVADGLEISLWAEQPMLRKPIQMNFDARGRLWVATSEIYPQLKPGQNSTDQVVVLEDTTGSGKADRATVFADDLLIPTGIEAGDGGVYVAQGTELLHLKDTDGDGRADVRRVVASGFGTEDTHCTLHSLRWGPDGRMYMNQSIFTRTNVETPHGVVRLKAGGIFRFDPRVERLEVLFRGWTNPWGHQFDAFGQSFVTDGANFQGVTWAVPGASYRTSPPAAHEMPSISPGVYPKFCGLEIVRSRHFPDDWQGDLITCDFRSHRIARFGVSDQGAGYVTREKPDVVRTTADSFRPVDLKLGPDGALYVADWSNPIIQHGEVDFRDPRRDQSHGRIWRITAKGRPSFAVEDFSRLSTTALLDRLLLSDEHNQRHSRRTLVERGFAQTGEALAEWLQSHSNDETAKLQARWLYQAFNVAHPALLAKLTMSPSAPVRAAAVRMEAGPESLSRLARLVEDQHPRVRLEAIRALGKHASAEAASLALSVLDRPMNPFLEEALRLTMVELAVPWLAALHSAQWRSEGRDRQLEFGLKAMEPSQAGAALSRLARSGAIPSDGSGPWFKLIGDAGGIDELNWLFDHAVLGRLAADAAARGLKALDDASRLRRLKPDRDLRPLLGWLKAEDSAVRLAAFQLAATWRLSEAVPVLLASAEDAAVGDDERAAAFSALRELGGTAVVNGLRQLMARSAVPAFRQQAVLTLARINLAAALPDVMAALARTADADADALWRGLLGIRGAAALLGEALRTATIPPNVARAGLRPAREGTQHAPLIPILLQHAGLALSPTALTPLQLRRLADQALEHGDAARGERIYRRPELGCVSCHAVGGAGGKIGPDLTSIGTSAPADYLLESLLVPGAKIKEGFHALLVTTKDQTSVNGMVVREDARELTLRDAVGKEITIPVHAIATRTDIGSLMPAGLIDALLPEERDDLVRFLSRLGRPGDFDASKGGVARVWKLYLVTAANQHLGVERAVRGDFTSKGWVPVFTLVDGTIARESFDAAFPNRTNTRGFYAATEFVAAASGPVRFQLDGEVKAVWVNAQPWSNQAQLTGPVNAGRNTLVVQLSELQPPANLCVKSTDVTFATD